MLTKFAECTQAAPVFSLLVVAAALGLVIVVAGIIFEICKGARP